ncbi:MAG: sodium:solute symporter [Methanobacteriota archaeon]|jgi:Na+/proline symporter|nr:MAG: sodium:solute symporter [Euryarchaeota archaeon]
METNIAYLLMIVTLGFFGYVGYQVTTNEQIDGDSYLSARGSQNSIRIGLSLFASGMGIWVLFGPSEVGYYGGFWDVTGYAVSAATPFLLLAYVGPIIRERLPSGVTLADYVRMRLGRPMQVYVGLISVLYMFTFLFAEFTAIGKGMGLLAGVEPIIPILAVAIATAGYTAYGGLPASLATDRIQAWIVLFLIVSLLLFLFGGDIGGLLSDAKAYTPEDIQWEWYHGSMSDMSTFESGLALVIAITAAEMFSQGNWQRAWASESDEALKQGAWMAAALVLPLVFVMGVLGAAVAGQGAVEDPAAAFFYLIEDAGPLFIAAFIVLAVALVASSADTLQNAIVASISRDLSDGNMGIKGARIWTITLMIPAIFLSTGPTIGDFTFNAIGIFEIFLFADLLATATVAPVLLTLWDKVSAKGALSGALSGLLSVVIYGTVTADVSAGFNYILHPTNELGLANLRVFLAALIGSAFVTVVGSYAMPDES